MTQLSITFNEVDEISQEDIEAAAEKFDDIKANPEKYFKVDNFKIINIFNNDNKKTYIN